jgi:hypothetical protein
MVAIRFLYDDGTAGPEPMPCLRRREHAEAFAAGLLASVADCPIRVRGWRKLVAVAFLPVPRSAVAL